MSLSLYHWQCSRLRKLNNRNSAAGSNDLPPQVASVANLQNKWALRHFLRDNEVEGTEVSQLVDNSI